MPDHGLLHVLVEGQTEATVVREVLTPHLQTCGWTVTYSIIRTQRSANTHRGGVTTWSKIERDIRGLLGGTSLRVLTTLFDYYGFPEDAPGMSARSNGKPHDQVRHVEEALRAAVGDRRFHPHLVLHELESWVFGAAPQLGELTGEPALADRLVADVADAGGVELVNDGVATAPSKRLARYYPEYRKTAHGPLVIKDVGLAALRLQCPHLDEWLTSLEALGK